MRFRPASVHNQDRSPPRSIEADHSRSIFVPSGSVNLIDAPTETSASAAAIVHCQRPTTARFTCSVTRTRWRVSIHCGNVPPPATMISLMYHLTHFRHHHRSIGGFRSSGSSGIRFQPSQQLQQSAVSAAGSRKTRSDPANPHAYTTAFVRSKLTPGGVDCSPTELDIVTV